MNRLTSRNQLYINYATELQKWNRSYNEILQDPALLALSYMCAICHSKISFFYWSKCGVEPNLGHNLSVGRGRMGLLWIKPLALTGDWLLQSRTKLHTISWITHDDWSRPIWGKANGVTAYLCACARKTGSTLQPSPNTPPPVWNTCLVRQFPYPSQPSFWIYIAGITPLKWHDITLNIRIYYNMNTKYNYNKY